MITEKQIIKILIWDFKRRMREMWQKFLKHGNHGKNRGKTVKKRKQKEAGK